jgi:hypothetical protein
VGDKALTKRSDVAERVQAILPSPCEQGGETSVIPVVFRRGRLERLSSLLGFDRSLLLLLLLGLRRGCLLRDDGNGEER